MSDEVPPTVEGDAPSIDYEEFQAKPEFQDLKRRLRMFVFPLAGAFLAWFLLYVFLGAFAHEFMAQPLLGMNVGIWFGLLQFLTTFAITTAYVMYTNRRIDPLAESLRAELEVMVPTIDVEGDAT